MLGFSAFTRALKTLTEGVGRVPMYVAVKPDLDSREGIVELLETIQFPSSLMVPEREFHCTVAYSREPIRDPSLVVSEFLPIEGTADEWAVFGREKDCLVLKLSSVDLRALHYLIREKYGATHDFPTYEAHLTVCDRLPPDFKLPDAKPNLKLRFNGFEIRPLDDK